MQIKTMHSEEEWELERKKQGSWGDKRLFIGSKPTGNLMLISWIVCGLLSFMTGGSLLWGIIPTILTVLVVHWDNNRSYREGERR